MEKYDAYARYRHRYHRRHRTTRSEPVSVVRRDKETEVSYPPVPYQYAIGNAVAVVLGTGYPDSFDRFCQPMTLLYLTLYKGK